MTGPAIIDLVLKIVSAVMIAGLSSFITVYLARNKFRSERWWEKKVQAYERVIEAFHNSKKFASEHMRAEYRGHELEASRDTELRKLSREAQDEISKASDIGSFVLSEEALKVLARYEAEWEAIPRQETWFEHLDADWGSITFCVESLQFTAQGPASHRAVLAGV